MAATARRTIQVDAAGNNGYRTHLPPAYSDGFGASHHHYSPPTRRFHFSTPAGRGGEGTATCHYGRPSGCSGSGAAPHLPHLQHLPSITLSTYHGGQTYRTTPKLNTAWRYARHTGTRYVTFRGGIHAHAMPPLPLPRHHPPTATTRTHARRHAHAHRATLLRAHRPRTAHAAHTTPPAALHATAGCRPAGGWTDTPSFKDGRRTGGLCSRSLFSLAAWWFPQSAIDISIFILGHAPTFLPSTARAHARAPRPPQQALGGAFAYSHRTTNAPAWLAVTPQPPPTHTATTDAAYIRGHRLVPIWTILRGLRRGT